ncbi:MAG TPA: hypothetical protein VEQ85_12745, partial [Lacipirellulaceae bacterium]|nr:hypothetical protein [Lacipirellulaceae bacterium]
MLQGSGPLVFDDPTSEPALLAFSTPTATATNVISVPLHIADSHGLIVNVASPTATLEVTAGIGSPSGDLKKQGLGTLRLVGASGGWLGKLVVDQGTLRVESAAALGAAGPGILVNPQGTLHLYRNTVVVNEAIELAGGRIFAEANGANVPTVSSTVTLSADSRIVSSVLFELTGRLTGPGGVQFSGSMTNVRGSNDFAGATRITAGRVDLYSPDGLGAASQGTTLEAGGQLFIRTATSEPIAVRGGTLDLSLATSSSGQVTLQSGAVNLPPNATYAAPILLDQSTTGASVAGRTSTFTGGATGTGHLKLGGTLNVSGAPLAQTGDLLIQTNGTAPVRLQAPNTFGGDLTVLGGNAHVDHALAVGGADNEFNVTNGALWLNQQVTRPTNIDRGRLILNRSDFVFDAPIRMKSGAVVNSGRVTGNIELEGPVTTAPSLEGGEFEGVISGQSNVDLVGVGDAPLRLTGQNTFAGVATVNQHVNAESASALGTTDWGTVVTGTLNVNAPTSEKLYAIGRGQINLNAPSKYVPRMLASTDSITPVVTVAAPTQFEGPAIVGRGALQINANSSVEGLMITGGGSVTVAAGKSLAVNGQEIALQWGKLEGAVTGAPTIRKTTKGGARLGPMPDFAGNIVIEEGVLEVVNGSLGSHVGSTTVTGNGQLMPRGSMGIIDNIYLNDARGYLNRGGIQVAAECCGAATVTVSGFVDLGPNGSIIGGGGNSRSAILQLFGPAQGGALTVNGSGSVVRFLNGNNSYTGVTDVREGYIDVSGNGRLSTTSGIVLHEAEGPFDATLLINNSEGGAALDRIAASVPIELRGGGIYAFGGGAEAFGTLDFAEGHSVVGSEIPLSAQRLERSPGATAFLDLAAPLAVAQAPESAAGIIPWMIARTAPGTSAFHRFGEYVNGQIRAIPVSSFLATANTTAEFNVALTAPASGISADRTIKSLVLGIHSTLQLNGHTLTVASGGIIGGAITGGTLRPGALSGGELIVHGGDVSANIVDGSAGPTSVTAGGTRLAGNNSFTGRLIFNDGDSYIGSEGALPENIDVQIIGANVTLQYAPTSTKHLDSLRLAGGGRFVGNGRFAIDEMLLERGQMQPGRLDGAGVIRKTTIGSVDLTVEAESTFNGQVIVEEGFLYSPNLRLAHYRVDGGRLRLLEGANSIQLNGGEMEFGSLTGPIQVTAPSTLIPLGASGGNVSLAGPITGSGNLTIASNEGFYGFSEPGVPTLSISRNNSGFTGEVAIRSAAVTISHGNALGSGPISIHAGGSLTLRSSIDLASPVVLKGGTLAGNTESTTRLLGSLTVLEPSYVGRLNIMGPVDLTH